MRRTTGIREPGLKLRVERRPPPAFVDQLAVAPTPVLEQQRRAVVVCPRQQELAGGAHPADRAAATLRSPSPSPLAAQSGSSTRPVSSSGCRSALAQIKLSCSTAWSKS